ncbi:MAG: response regulator [Anaerolineales bacterium]
MANKMTPIKILVIDDEQGIREGTKRALSPEGYQVDTAENGDQGLELIQKNNYDLVLLDVMMPGISGIELIEKIHQVDPETVCIIITGYATVEMAVRAIKEGAYDFLTKPFTVDDLLIVVNQGLERRRLSLEAKRLQSIEEEAKKLAEEKARLEELDRAKMQFIRLVTHELQAPIAAIYTYLRLIVEGYVPEERKKEILEKCMRRAEEQMAMITDLLELGRIQAWSDHKPQDKVQLDEILKEVVDGLRRQAEEKRIELRVNIPQFVPPVLGRAEPLKSVWVNLLGNAIKYTQSGYVEASIRLGNDEISGEVKDSGMGIPKEDQEKLFQEFYRASNAKTSDIPGTGLGLTIVKRVIEGYGGRVWVESEVGKGSTFGFALPIMK